MSVFTLYKLPHRLRNQVRPAAVHLTGQVVELLQHTAAEANTNDSISRCSFHDYSILGWRLRVSLRRPEKDESFAYCCRFPRRARRQRLDLGPHFSDPMELCHRPTHARDILKL